MERDKSIYELTYEEAKVKFSETKRKIALCKSKYLKKDLRKYLIKLDKEIKKYELSRKGKQ